jgi:hypothetical protein
LSEFGKEGTAAVPGRIGVSVEPSVSVNLGEAVGLELFTLSYERGKGQTGHNTSGDRVYAGDGDDVVDGKKVKLTISTVLGVSGTRSSADGSADQRGFANARADTYLRIHSYVEGEAEGGCKPDMELVLGCSNLTNIEGLPVAADGAHGFIRLTDPRGDRTYHLINPGLPEVPGLNEPPKVPRGHPGLWRILPGGG